MSWKPENTVITNVGLQMLSKAQVGIGKLEVTKVVTTDIVSSIDDNKTLTGDSTQILYKQECEIMNTYGGEIFGDNGEEQNAGESRITARVSNENVSDTGDLKSYEIHQIIIFMRLTNLSDPNADMGEVPYMVAQSDEIPDYMPDFAENPVAINYDLYILHSGVAQITVNNDVTGYLPKDAFDAVIKEIKTDISELSVSKAGENTGNVKFKPWTPKYDVDDESVNWSKVDGTTEVSGSTTAERFNQYEDSNIAVGENSHAENSNTVVLSANSHVEGSYNYIGTNSPTSHVEGEKNSATLGSNQHIEGCRNQSSGANTHTEGSDNRVSVSSGESNNHIEGRFNHITDGPNHHVGGEHNKVSGSHNVVYGCDNVVSGTLNLVNSFDSTIEGKYNNVGGEGQYVSGDTFDTIVQGISVSTYATKNSLIIGDSIIAKTVKTTQIIGNNNEAESIDNSNISGQFNNVKGSDNSSVSGYNNKLNGSINNSVTTGSGNSLANTTESMIAGNDNTVTGAISSFVSGEMNSLTPALTDGEPFNIRNSTVIGNNNTVQGLESSIITGYLNNVSILGALYNDTAKVTNSCIITGESNNIIGCQNSVISGKENNLEYVKNSFVAGVLNDVNGYLNSSLVLGKNNTLTDSENNLYTLDSVICVGNNNVISNENYPESKGAIGCDNEVTGPYSYAIGKGLKVDSFNQVVVGKYNVATEASFIVGTGDGSSRRNGFWVKDTTAYAGAFESSGKIKGYTIQAVDQLLVGNRDILNIIDSKIAALVDGAPEALNTLKELADALSTAEDVITALQQYSVEKKFISQSEELVSSNGVCTWAVTHGFNLTTQGGNNIGGYIIQIMDRTGNVVNCNIQNSSGVSMVKFSSTSNISANTYKAIVIGNSSGNN